MNRPPKATIIIENLPNGTDNWLMGIDTQFFNINKLLKGIKLIPPGFHLVHCSIPANENDNKHSDLSPQEIISSSLRHGYWFECKENDVLVVRWDEDLEQLLIVDSESEEEQLNYSKSISRLGEIYSYMIKYPENENLWGGLTAYIDLEIIEEFLPQNNNFGEISTIMSSKEENMVLLETLRQKNPKNKYDERPNKEVRYTIMQFKLNKSANLSVEEITNNYLDKSWYLKDLYGNDLELFFGELQLAFINFIIMGNFCSNVQWLNLLKLISMSSSFLLKNRNFTMNFLTVFENQLNRIPEDYLSVNALVDVKNYISVMESFIKDIFSPQLWDKSCCGKLKLNGLIIEKWNTILRINRERFGIDLQKLRYKVDENKTEIYDLNDYDENDEDAPAIVM